MRITSAIVTALTPLVVASLLAACARQPLEWSRAGADGAAVDAAIAECRAETDHRLAHEANAGLGYYSPRYGGYKRGYGIFGPGGDDRSDVRRIAAGDLASQLRSRYRALHTACMERQGFALTPVADISVADPP